MWEYMTKIQYFETTIFSSEKKKTQKLQMWFSITVCNESNVGLSQITASCIMRYSLLNCIYTTQSVFIKYTNSFYFSCISFLKQLYFIRSFVRRKSTALYSEYSDMLAKLLFVILYKTEACIKTPCLFVYWRSIRPATDASSTRSSLEQSFN